MKRLLLSSIVIVLALTGFSQTQTFYKRFNNTKGIDVIRAKEGGYYILLGGANPAALQYMAENGDTIWTKTYPGATTGLTEIEQLPDGSLFLALMDTLIKTQKNGNVIWIKDLLTPNFGINKMSVYGSAVSFTANSNGIAAGRLDFNGDTLWTFRSSDIYYGLVHDAQYMYVAGVNSSLLGYSKRLLEKLDTNGVVIYMDSTHGAHVNNNTLVSAWNDMMVHSNGNIIAVGHIGSYVGTGMQGRAALGIFAPNQHTPLSYVFDSTHYWNFDAVAEAPNGDLMVTFYSLPGNAGLVKLDANGNVLWKKDLTTDSTRLTKILATPDGGFIIAGEPYYGGGSHTALIKVDSLGNFPFTRLSGSVYLDLNGNASRDAGEVGVPDQILHITPQNHYAVTRANGEYFNIVYDTGQVTVTYPVLPVNWGLTTPGSHIFNISAGDTSVTALDFGIEPTGVVKDLAAQIGGFSPRAATNTSMYITVQNNGTQTAYSPKVSLMFDTLLTITGSSLPGFLSTDSLVEWTLDSLLPFQNRAIRVDYIIHATPPLGTSFTTLVDITWATGFDNTPLDNWDTLSLWVRNSFDPNNKLSYSSTNSTEGYFTEYDTTLEYVINFQNTGNDTAYTVLLTDTIDISTLDIASLQVKGASHAYNTHISDEGVLSFRFDNIMLPDSTTNEPESKGFIRFHINTKHGLAHNTHVLNMAGIYFDFNTVVNTNTAENIYIRCDSTNKFTLNDSQVCARDTLRAVYTGIGANELMWNSVLWSAGTGIEQVYIADTTGNGPLALTTKLGGCVRTTSKIINVIAAPTPNIVMLTGGAEIFCATTADSYEWYFDGVLLPENSQNIIPYDSGSYTVRVTIDGCISELSAPVDLLGVGVGINNPSPMVAFNVYPSPTYGYLYVTFPNAKDVGSGVRIYNLMGAEISITNTRIISGNTIGMDITLLPKGVYVMAIETFGGPQFARIVKQ
jgi:uncharacterized repeat protein (TIGR01451 family)